MTTRRPGRFGILAAATFTLLLAVPTVALANTSSAIAQTGGMTATLPLLGSSLTVAVTLDTSGNVSSVNLDPVGSYSASQLDSHAVSFDSTGGTSSVRVKAFGSKMSISASAGSLADLLGSGTWTADVFGTGAASHVAYTVGDSGGGMPAVKIDSVDAAAGITATIQPGKSWEHDEHDDRRAVAVVDFTANGFVKHLTISVSVDQDREKPARLKITLSGRDRQSFDGTLADLAGNHTWNGRLCDGTAVSATFAVTSDGKVSFVSAAGAAATQVDTMAEWGYRHWKWDRRGGEGNRGTRGGVVVRFDGTRTFVAAHLESIGGSQYELVLDSNAGKCRGTTGPTPKVNTPVSPDATKRVDGRDSWGTHDGSWGDHDGTWGDGGSWGGGTWGGYH